LVHAVMVIAATSATAISEVFIGILLVQWESRRRSQKGDGSSAAHN
jgi:hypothetical protein